MLERERSCNQLCCGGSLQIRVISFSANFIGLSEKASEKLSKISERLDKEDGLD